MNQVTIIYHHESEGWWAESPECPGYSAGSNSVDELRQLVREEGLPLYFDDKPFEIVSEQIVEHTSDAA